MTVGGPNWTGRGGLTMTGSALTGIGFTYVGESGMVLSGEAIVPPIHLDMEGAGGIRIYGKATSDFIPLYPKIRVKDVSNGEQIKYIDDVEKQLTYVLEVLEQVIVGPDPQTGTGFIKINDYKCEYPTQNIPRPIFSPEPDPVGNIWSQIIFLSDAKQVPDIKSQRIIKPVSDPLPGSILIPIKQGSDLLLNNSSEVKKGLDNLRRVQPIISYTGGIKRVKICQ